MGLLALGLLGLRPAAAQAPTGTIAYLRDTQSGLRSFDEIRLIGADGSHDRLLWTVPDPAVHDLDLVDWRPDGAELAFTSNHEMACSFFQSDVFAIRPDGAGLRRITNAPQCGDLATYPTGTVTVDVTNTSFDSLALFVYVEGAPGVLFLSLGPLAQGSLTFTDVADFGAGVLQHPVAIQAPERWFSPGVAADVAPGATVHAGTLSVGGAGTGLQEFGAKDPAWRYDGAQIGFAQGLAGLYQLPAYPAAGQLGEPLLGTYDLPIFITSVDWGPTAATASQVLYAVSTSAEAGIYLAEEASGSPGSQLVGSPEISTNSLVLDLDWLPDGSGFLFSATDFFLSHSNIYEYNFASGTVTPLTSFTDEFAGWFSISPDGQLIVFDRTDVLLPGPGEDPPIDLWLMERDGSNQELFVENGTGPDWSRQAPVVYLFRELLPTILR